MTRPTPPRSERRVLRSAIVGTAALAVVIGGSAVAATQSAKAPNVAAPELGKASTPAAGRPEARGSYDARAGATNAARIAQQASAAKVSGSRAAESLTTAIGRSSVLDIDPTTGTVRQVADLAGTLTGRSSAAPAAIALGYVRAHHDALGLTTSDLGTLHLRQDYVDVVGTHHLSWVQRIGGVEVFGNGLTAAVDRTGRLLEVGGSPVSTPSRVPAADGRVGSAPAAIRAARGLSGESSTAPSTGDTADTVAFVVGNHTYRAWRVLTTSGANPALTVVDAATGKLLYRRSTSSDAAGEAPVTRAPLSAYRPLIKAEQKAAAAPRTPKKAAATTKPKGSGLVVTYFPGAPKGGTYRRVDFHKNGWIAAYAKKLTGNNAHTWSDVVDDNRAMPDEEVSPSRKNTWDHQLKPITLPNVSFCDNPYPCSWNPKKPYSWKINRAQNAIQVFFYVNNWHDHLMKSPIGFTEAAGNFQRDNLTGEGVGGDAVHAQSDDGANTDNGLPDGNHVDNANMNTPPDGHAPTMQMYLQHVPGTSYPNGDPFAPTNVGDEADTVYHEYTHGLSNRLVVDADGQSTLGGVQAGAMGEAWSDWYAMDYLVGSGLQPDQPGVADVVLFQYDGEGVFLDRTEPIDCSVEVDSARCTGGATGHTGGYTYADYAQVSGGPEVHSDGEIWAQTLWDLRTAIGQTRAESLVTRAMELAPANPSFIDMRNSILIAENAVYHGQLHSKIAAVFAKRGMGYYAGSLGGDDTAPAADFETGPTSSATGTIAGTVTDTDSGQPVAGAVVTLKFQGGGTPTNPSAVTAADGTYSIGPVPAGHYAALTIGGAGYEQVTSSVDVTAGTTPKDAVIRRDWAATSGGATVASFTGPDFSPSCGPAQALDLNQGTGWGSTTGDDNGTPTNTFVPKQITVHLPTPVTIDEFAVDPSATCGDGGSASTGAYKIETSVDGTLFTQAASGTFTQSDRGVLTSVTPTAPQVAVTDVRFTILGNQTPDFATNCPAGAFSGCSYTDLTELEVYGSATG